MSYQKLSIVDANGSLIDGNLTLGAGESVVVTVKYESDDSTTTGIGFTVDYGSQLDGVVALLHSADNIAGGNPTTADGVTSLAFGYASLFGAFPGSGNVDLATVTLTNDGASSVTVPLYLEFSSSHAGYSEMNDNPAPLPPLDITTNDIDENSGESQVIASVDGSAEGVTYTLADNTNYGEGPAFSQDPIVAPTDTAGKQNVYISNSQLSEDGSQLVLTVSYSSDALTTGIGFKVDFDASQFGNPAATLITAADNIAAGAATTTDGVTSMAFGYASLFGAFPAENDLATITLDILASGPATIDVVATSGNAGYDTVTQGHSVELPAVSPLSIDADGNVTLSVNPDFESVPTYSFEISSDAGQSGSATVSIGNVDEVSPTITSGDTAVAIDENSGAGQVVYTATADDSADTSAGVTFTLAGEDADAFSIDATSGGVTLTADPDHETQSSYSFTVVANDGVSAIAVKEVSLAINNVDDAAPTVTSSGSAASIDENSGSGQVIYTATADDSADMSEGSVTFSLTDDSTSAVSIDSVSGEVTLIADPDFESQSVISFGVIATDSAGNASNPQSVSVNIDNLDDTAPTITSGSVATSITENTGAGQVVYTASADDSSDVSDGVTYSLAGADAAAFTIDPASGDVSLDADPDFEAQEQYNFAVVATDAANNSSSAQAVTLDIINELDSKPAWLSAADAGSIDENSGAGQVVYTASAEVNLEGDTDGAVGVGLTYSLSDDSSGAFTIDSASGDVTLTGDPDHETIASYSFSVVATDDLGNVSAALAVSLGVNDLDEVAATITSSDTADAIDENGSSQVIYTATADDSGDISGGVTFSLTDDSDSALSINTNNGQVSIDGATDHETQSVYSFGVVATDAAGNESEAQSVTLDINDLDDAAPTLMSGDSADSVDENAASGQVVYTATADDSGDDVADGPISFSLAVGSDSEFSINSASGDVSFNATADHESDSEYSFTVVATDAAGNASEGQSVTMSINDLDDAAPTVTSGDSAGSIDENSGAQVIYTATADDSGDDVVDGPITFSLTEDSDSALSIDSETGTVTLYADTDHETQSVYSFTVVVTDAAGNASDPQSITLDINDLDELAPIIKGQEVAFALASYSGAGQVVYSPSTDETATFEAAYDDVNDVTGTLSFTLTSDASDRFDIDSATGEVTYLPNPQTSLDNEYIDYTVTATDEAGNSSSVDLQIVISGEELNLPLFGEPEGYQTEATASVVQNEDTDKEEYVTVVTSVSGALSADVQSGDEIYAANVTDDTPMSYAVGATSSAAENSASNQVVYSAVSTGYLSIDGFGVVSIHGTPWADGADSFEFTVTATDASGNESQQHVTVATADYTAEPATDGDVTYSLAEGHDTALGINPRTGEIMLLESPDYEDTPQYAMDVIVSNADGELHSYQVIVDVDNTDDVAPTITSGDTASAIDENSGSQVVYNAESDDSADPSGDAVYSLASGSDSALSIDSATGAVTLNENPDHESQSEYNFTVVATDGAGNASEQAVTLQVNDLDEVTPLILSADSAEVNENNPADQVIYTASAHDATSIVEQGAISQQFVRNADGTLTVQFFVEASVAADFSDNLEAIQFAFNYESEQAGILSIASIDYPSDPLLKVSNSEDYGQVNFAMLFTDLSNNSNPDSLYDADGDLAIAEVTFNAGDHDTMSTFTVSDVGLTEAGGTSEYPGGQSVVEYAINDGGRSTYSLVDGHDQALSINASTGEVTLSGSADFEATEEYSFTIVATDASNNSSSQAVTVSVNNLDEIAPEFTSGDTATAIDENTAAGQVIYTATADDSADISGGFTFALSDDSDSALSIDAQSGAVTLADSPDQEVQEQYSFTVIATDAAGHDSSQGVTLNINDLDDTAAVITSSDTATAIDENTGANQEIYTATADDSADVSDGVTFSLAEGSDAAISIDADSGVVSLSTDPDHEAQADYSFAVIATDAAGNASKAQSVTLSINDLDDTSAVITSGDTAVAIDENSGTGQVIYTASADDSLDVSEGVTFSLSDDSDVLLSINEETGAVTLDVDPDHETQSAFNFTVVATDEGGNTVEKTIELSINDLDEVAPTITSGGDAVRLDENTAAGQVVYTATADDSADISGGVTFSLARGSAPGLAIDEESGVVKLVKTPDYESRDEYAFTVVATDAAGNASEQEVTLHIDPKTDVKVTHWGSDIHVSGVRIQQNGAVIDSTDGAGTKRVDGDHAGSEITVAKDLEVSDSSGVVDAADALAAIKMAVNINVDAPDTDNTYADGSTDNALLQMAADFNSDGRVSSRDALEILKFAAGVGGSAAPEWMFVRTDDSEIANDDDSPEDAVSYTALIKGDIDANWTSSDDSETVDKDHNLQDGDAVYRFDSSKFSFSDNSDGVFSADSETGIVTALSSESGEFSFTLSRNTDGKEKTVTLEVEAADNSGPVFTSAEQVSVASGIEAGDVVYTAVATDDSKLVKYRLDGESDGLTINSRSGDVTLSHNTDESDALLSFTVVAKDLDGNETPHTVILSVLAVPDTAAPEIGSAAEVSITENTDDNVVYIAEATDAYGNEVTYSLGRGSDPALTINSETGEVSLSETANVEGQAAYKFVLVATDSEGNTSSEKVVVRVDNTDEVAPVFTSGDSATVVENSGEEQVVYTAQATDADHNDENGTVTYSLVDHTTYPEAPAADAGDSSANQLPAPEQESGVQNVYVSQSTVSEDGSQVELVVSYSADVDGTTGIGFNLGFDSSEFEVNNVELITAADNIAGGAASSADGVTSLAFGYASLFGAFPGSSSVELAKITLDVTGDIPADISITEVSSSAVHTFVGHSHTVDGSAPAAPASAEGDYVSADALSIDESTGEVTLAHSPNHEAIADYSFTVVATDAANNSSEQDVSLTVINADEAAPEFTSGSEASIGNDTGRAGQVIYTASVTDSGDVSEGRVTFELSEDSDPALTINEHTGRVRLTDAPNSDQQDVYNFTVIATDSADNSSEQDVSLTLAIYDTTAPTITSGDTIDAIDENSGDQVVYTAESDDSDTVWSLSSNSSSGLSIDAATGEVTLSNPDHETSAGYKFTVVATDAVGNSSQQTLSFGINDLDEMAPVMTSGATGSVVENSGSNQVIYEGRTIDSLDVSDGVTYELITTGAPDNSYAPAPVAGYQYVFVDGSPVAGSGGEAVVSIDYTAVSNMLTGLGLRIHFDSSVLSLTDITDVFEDDLIYTNVEAQADVDDLDGIASTDSYVDAGWASYLGDWTSTGMPEDLLTLEFDVALGASGSTEIGFSAIDTAIGYDFIGVSHDLHISELSIDSDTGDVSLASNPNYESQSGYDFTVVATDGVGQTASQDVSITVENEDEVAPVITSDASAQTIDENSGHSQIVYRAQADDSADVSHGSVVFSLAAGHDSTIAINADSGEVLLLEDPDHESQSEYNFTVIATDAAGHVSNSQAVTLTINDLDDSIDVITSSDTATAIDENSGAGQVIYTATSEDTQDVSVGLVYSLADGSDAALSINAETGEVSLSADPDHEAQDTYSFGVLVTDSVGHVSDVQSVTLDINDLDEVDPTIDSDASDTASVNENSGAGQVVYTAEASDSDFNGDEVINFSLADDTLGFSIDESGVVTTNDDFAADHEDVQSQSFTVVATDASGNSSEQVVSVAIIDLDDSAPTLVEDAVAVAVEAGSTGQVIYTASADDSGDISDGVTYSLANQDRTDLSIDATTGAVTLEESADTSGYDFTVVATDGSDLSDQQSVSMAVYQSVSGSQPEGGSGDIGQSYTRNADGTITLHLMLNESVESQFVDGITTIGFDFSPLGSLDILSIEAAQDTAANMVTEYSPGVYSVEQLYVSDLQFGASIMDVTFDSNDASFTVDNVVINEETAIGGSSSDVVVNDQAGTSGNDVFELGGGYSNVFTGEGVDTLIVTDQVDASVMVDFDSGSDTFDVASLLADNGYDADDSSAYSGLFDDVTNVLSITIDTDPSEAVSNTTYEVTLTEGSEFEDDDLSADFSTFIA